MRANFRNATECTPIPSKTAPYPAGTIVSISAATFPDLRGMVYETYIYQEVPWCAVLVKSTHTIEDYKRIKASTAMLSDELTVLHIEQRYLARA